jgi:hypothetical protein
LLIIACVYWGLLTAARAFESPFAPFGPTIPHSYGFLAGGVVLVAMFAALANVPPVRRIAIALGLFAYTSALLLTVFWKPWENLIDSGAAMALFQVATIALLVAALLLPIRFYAGAACSPGETPRDIGRSLQGIFAIVACAAIAMLLLSSDILRTARTPTIVCATILWAAGAGAVLAMLSDVWKVRIIGMLGVALATAVGLYLNPLVFVAQALLAPLIITAVLRSYGYRLRLSDEPRKMRKETGAD